MLLGRMTREKGSVKVVVSATKVDGVVLHFAPNGHSLNYRSCVIHGDATPVSPPKKNAMQCTSSPTIWFGGGGPQPTQ